MTGGGKYEKEATAVRLMTDADGVLVIVLGGRRGSGFSLQLSRPEDLGAIAGVLEQVVLELRKEQS